MMIIDKNSITATKKLVEQGKTKEAVDDIKKMLDIKQAHLWRSDAIAPCCGSLNGFACQITNEIEILENILKALEGGDKAQATNLLEGYIRTVEENRRRESPEPQYR